VPDLRTYRPGGARIVAYGVALVMAIMTVVIGVALPSYVTFTPAEYVTLAVILGAALALLHGVGRSYVRVGAEGVEVLNGYRRHVVAWSQIEGFAMNTGAPWPTMVTTDDERVMLFAIQGSDGAYAREAVSHLRSRLP